MNKFEAATNLIWATALTLTVSSIVWSISYYYSTVNTAAMENGYEQGSLPGQIGVYWIKKSAEKED